MNIVGYLIYGYWIVLANRHVTLKALLQDVRLPVVEIENHLPKQPVGPREPLPSPVRHLSVLMSAAVYRKE